MSADEFNTGPLTLDEQMKIVSLLENPPEAAMVRACMRHYEIPENLEFKWGENKTSMTTMRHLSNPQNSDELAWMLAHIERLKVGKLLEVGSSFGGTLKRMAAVLPVGSTIVSVDLPCDNTPPFLNPMASLREECRRIAIRGGNVQLFVGDSHNAEVVEAVRQYAPFDFGFIDGDHSYAGIKADWENYGPMCKVVGFHDIGGGIEECERFWAELKASGLYRTEECISTQGMRFGIGIVYRE
jgi:hypothetical protein